MSDICKACGHSRVFHQIGRGTGVPAGKAYCDDRHSLPCSCTGFVESWAPLAASSDIAAVEQYLASCVRRRDWHGVADAANDLRVLEAVRDAKR